MKTQYKFIHFEPAPENTNKICNMWLCKNNRSGAILCRVGWYPPWRKFVTEETDFLAIFSDDCHADISDFLKQLQKERG